jgi:hypothetical protein
LTGSENRPDAEASEDFIFPAVHPAVSIIRQIIEPRQVQDAVEGIKQQLMAERDSAAAGLAGGVGHANHDFACGYAPAGVVVQFERQHIRRPGDPEERLVQPRHPGVADQGEGQFLWPAVQKRQRPQQVPAKERTVRQPGGSADVKMHVHRMDQSMTTNRLFICCFT